MISDRNILKLSNVLFASAIVLTSLLTAGVIGFSMLFAFPLHIGIIFLLAALMYRQRTKSSEWKGVVPPALRYILPVVAIFGAACIAFGFSSVSPDTSPSGEAVHHLNAYFENGRCYAIFNKDAAVGMPDEFCKKSQADFATVFCGFWLAFSAVLNWASWKCQRPGKAALN